MKIHYKIPSSKPTHSYSLFSELVRRKVVNEGTRPVHLRQTTCSTTYHHHGSCTVVHGSEVFDSLLIHEKLNILTDFVNRCFKS